MREMVGATKLIRRKKQLRRIVIIFKHEQTIRAGNCQHFRCGTFLQKNQLAEWKCFSDFS